MHAVSFQAVTVQALKDEVLVEDPEAEREALLLRLEDVARRLRRELGEEEDSHVVPLARLTSFVSRRRQRFVAIKPEMPLLALVFRGHKEVAHGRQRLKVSAGHALLVPAGLSVNITNVPDARGDYRVLALQVAPEVCAQLQQRHPSLCVSPSFGAFTPQWVHTVRPERASLLALLHYCESVLERGTHAAVLRHRLEDVVLSLSVEQRGLGDASAPRSHFRQAPILAVRQLLRGVLGEPVPAARVARECGVSQATLRRQLSAQGTTLRQLLLEERMLLAQSLMRNRELSVAEVALRCGYLAPAKFSRQYRQWAGRTRSRG